jgi:tetratricopeptide (TPR) repeat protein
LAKLNILRLSAVALVLWALSACTTSKNTWLTRTFHNTCAHYNGYFWGNLAYDEGVASLNQTHKDDYTDIIPVYVYPDPPEAPAIYPNMSRAIKKADTMIQKHTITDKAKHEIPDAVHYIKYCYLLLAKAHLYKNDLVEASDVLEYATKEYRKTDFKYEALVWQARTYDQLGSVSKAEEVIDLLKSSKKMPKKLIPEVYAVVADWNMRIGQYPEVAAQLTKALKYETDKKTRARYCFIIGQLDERDGDNKKAYDSYTQCLNLHPYNELDFEARIKRALLYMGGAKENEKIKENLVKMLRPTKYLDDRDQIYYALAEIALKEKNEELATTDLHKSIKASTTNKIQKAISYLALGNLAFDHEDYRSAKKFYDSTIVALPAKFHGRDTILAKKENLDKLVRNLNVIDREDSLQKIALRGEKGAEKYVDSLMAVEKKNDEEKKEQEKQAAADATQNNNSQGAATNNGKWYFYNPSAVSQGIAEFNQKWGNRPLEDNWRRSHKISDNTQVNGNESSADSSKKNLAVKKDTLQNKYSSANSLKNIPLTDAKMKASNDSMIEAYYNVGDIYKEYLKNNHRGEEDFEEMLTRFPDNKYKLIVYYDLYIMYTQTGNTERADYYKNILLTKYPDTEYALLIRDPDKYKQQQEASREEILKIYTTTLASYKAANYAEVLNDCAQVDSLYPKNPEAPKFAFMEAAAIGHEQGLEAYKNALEKVVIEFPKDTVKVVAQSILDYLNKKKAKDAGAAAAAKTDTIPVEYSKDEDSTYFYIVAIDNKQSSKVNTVRNSITTMNTNIYSENKFTMEDIFLNSNQQMLVVHKFASSKMAKDYFNYILSNPDLLKALPEDSYQCFFISDKNYHTLYKHGKSDEYMKFFNDNLR